MDLQVNVAYSLLKVPLNGLQWLGQDTFTALVNVLKMYILISILQLNLQVQLNHRYLKLHCLTDLQVNVTYSLRKVPLNGLQWLGQDTLVHWPIDIQYTSNGSFCPLGLYHNCRFNEIVLFLAIHLKLCSILNQSVWALGKYCHQF